MLRQHFSIFLLQPKSYALCQPWFKGFYGQWGSVIFPAVLSFDLARFWIDGNSKRVWDFKTSKLPFAGMEQESHLMPVDRQFHHKSGSFTLLLRA